MSRFEERRVLSMDLRVESRVELQEVEKLGTTKVRQVKEGQEEDCENKVSKKDRKTVSRNYTREAGEQGRRRKSAS